MEIMPTVKGARIRHQTTCPGTPSLLPFAVMPEPGIMLNKNGAFMAGWSYTAPDDEALSNAQRNGICHRLNRALARLGSEWMLHIDAIRLPANDYPPPAQSHFPDLATQLIDDERREQIQSIGAAFRTQCTLVATYLPNDVTTGYLNRLFFSAKDADTPYEKALADFKQAIEKVEADLAAVFGLVRLRDRLHEFDPLPDTPTCRNKANTDDLANHLRHVLTGDFQPRRLASVPVNMDFHIGMVDFQTGINPVVGEKTVAVIAIDDFPAGTCPGMLGLLSEAGLPYRWSTRFIFQDAVVAEKKLRRQRSRWQGRVRSFFDQLMNTHATERSHINQDAQRMVAETDEALSALASGQVGYGYYTSCVVLMDQHQDRLRENARYIASVLEQAGFGARIETLNTVEAFLSSIPGIATANIRKPLLSTMHLSHLLPTSSIWPGHATAPHPDLPPASPPLLLARTAGTTIFNFNLHVSDVGHTLIFGPTGAGKSTLLALIAAQFRRYPQASVTVFDKGRSMQVLTMAVGGRHFDLDDHLAIGFAPFKRLAEAASEVLWANEWVEQLVRLQGLRMMPRQRALLHQALLSIRQNPQAQTLTGLHIAVQDAALKEALNSYTVSGPYGRALDDQVDRLQLSSFTTIETGELMNMDDKIKLPILTYLFRQVERNAKGQPYLLILDEAWLMLSHNLFKEKIREWLKTLRKANVAVVLATQSLSDASRSGIMDVLAESCPTKIYLPNAEASNSQTAEQYRSLGLIDEELQLLEALTPKKQYFVTTGEGKRVIDLALGQIALAFTAASSPMDIAQAKTLYRQDADHFVKHWLAHRQVVLSDKTPAGHAACV